MLVKTKGVTLQATPFQEKARIITVFTEKEVLVSLIVKGLNTKRPSFLAITTPFCEAEFIYKKGRKESNPCRRVGM